MITAISHISADVAMIPQVAQEVAAIEGVSEVYSTTGDTDLIAMVRVMHHDELADIVADRIGKIEGVTKMRTYIAFKTFSKHDLEQAFGLGL